MATEFTTRYHEQTHKEVLEMRAKFNDIKTVLDSAHNGIHWADFVMEKVNIMGDIATSLGIEDLDSEQFVRNIHLYVEDYLRKLNRHVNSIYGEAA